MSSGVPSGRGAFDGCCPHLPWVGERKPHNAPITLAEYDPGWPSCSLERPTGSALCLVILPFSSSTSARPPCSVAKNAVVEKIMHRSNAAE